jgi:arylsulfatase A-like enzyme
MKHKYLPFRVISAICLGLLLCSLSGCGPNTGEKETDSPLNFVVIFTDEMQFSDLGCYGGKIPTPNIDALADEGILFLNAYTPASMCTPSRYAVLTGQFPGRCSAPSFATENPTNEPYNIAWNSWITADKKTLPRVLSENGYVTGMAGKWHIGKVPEGTILPEFLPNEDLASPATNKKLKHQQSVYQGLVESLGGFDDARSVVWENYDGHDLKALSFHNFPWMAQGALSFLEEQKENKKPFFLYFAPTAVHGPNHVADLDRDMTYTPGGQDSSVLEYMMDITSLKEELAGSEPKTRHRYAGVSQTDYVVGLIREKLVELGLADNTVIMYMADHNVEPGKATSFEKGIHIPMIVSWPGETSGVISSAMVSNTDLYPTILEASGIELPVEYMIDGADMMPIIEDPTASTRDFIFAENGYTRSVSDGTYKYIALRFPSGLVKRMKSGKLDHVPSYVKAWPQAHSAIAMNGFPCYFDQDQLYNLKEDPYEQSNLYDAKVDSEELKILKAALKSHLESFEHSFDLSPVPFLETEEYRKLALVNMSFDLLSIPWLSRDHGFITWPPESK